MAFARRAVSDVDRRRTDNEVRAEREHVRAEGSIKNVNTMDDFKNADKPAMLQLAARQVITARSVRLEGYPSRDTRKKTPRC